MNTPLTIVCAGIAGIGLLILSVCLYCALAYGHGNFEAGNFHRCTYWSERDETTGRPVKRWDTNWELTESTEGSPLYRIDMWFIGLGFVVVGAAIWVGERSTRHKRGLHDLVL